MGAAAALEGVLKQVHPGLDPERLNSISWEAYSNLPAAVKAAAEDLALLAEEDLALEARIRSALS